MTFDGQLADVKSICLLGGTSTDASLGGGAWIGDTES